MSAKGDNYRAHQRSHRVALVARLIGIVLMVAAAAHLLSAWVAFVIFGALWVFVMWSKTHR